MGTIDVYLSELTAICGSPRRRDCCLLEDALEIRIVGNAVHGLRPWKAYNFFARLAGGFRVMDPPGFGLVDPRSMGYRRSRGLRVLRVLFL